MTALLEGDLPHPYMADTFDCELVELGDGHAVFQAKPRLKHYNPLVSVHGGWYATLLDFALGCEVQTKLPAGRSTTTRKTMKALTFKHYGKSPEIGITDVARPTPKADELLVQVHAASVNPIDNMIPTGIFKAVVKFQLPATLGRSGRCRARGRQPRDPVQGRQCGLRQHLRPAHGLHRRIRGATGKRCRAHAGQPGLR
jgi:hypothetical protein